MENPVIKLYGQRVGIAYCMILAQWCVAVASAVGRDYRQVLMLAQRCVVIVSTVDGEYGQVWY